MMTGGLSRTPLPLRIFVGSSGPQEVLASRLADALAAFMTPVHWRQAFRPGETTYENLLRISREVDFAIFVIAKDDLRWKGGDALNGAHVTRDNVIWEHALLTGALGGARSIMMVDESTAPVMPTDLGGVVEVRWNSNDGSSFDRAIEEIYRHVLRSFADLGLGWWAIRFENHSVDGRAMYGTFELVRKGGVTKARYGNSYYADAPNCVVLRHQLRCTWDSSNVTFARNGDGDARMFVVADVVSQAPPGESERKARIATRIHTVFEIQQSSEGEFFRGRYVDAGLAYSGCVAARRLGNCDRVTAEIRAREEFGLAVNSPSP